MVHTYSYDDGYTKNGEVNLKTRIMMFFFLYGHGGKRVSKAANNCQKNSVPLFPFSKIEFEVNRITARYFSPNSIIIIKHETN